ARLAGQCGCLLTWPYAVGGTVTAAALANDPGSFLPWGGMTVFRYEGPGLLAVGATLLLAVLGHWVLLGAWRKAEGKRRRQIGVVGASSTLGLGSVMGLAFPLLGIDATPWPLLLLPLYLAVLAYGVLRYELMAANQWVRRALTGGLLMALAGLATALPTGLVAAEAPWAVSALAVSAALALWGPVRRRVDRMVFPGGEVTAAELAGWRAALDQADDDEDITRRADALLRDKLRVPQSDWADAPPGPRRVVEVMDGVRMEALRTLAARRAFADRQRLAELGALAATVAHDLRNPMNIVAMAVADANPSIRTEVTTQLGRMEALVRDLLDYAKPWTVTPTEVDITAAVAEVAWGTGVETDIPAGLTVHADPLRLSQALGNLLVNARTAGGRVMVAAEKHEDGVRIHVCDDGPGIPEDIRDTLFQPFISRGPGGTGLGLAIVAKVMSAHGGTVELGRRPSWTTCLTLTFGA
ncbi:MAG TPA: HAMP domain-containing sensor histidine kinase, partial [Candidatus Omnitrophota bacterium]|nr:HAMP domain-containing sensor histidine kinase [Candidatus Omnitrophota bacterium]